MVVAATLKRLLGLLRYAADTKVEQDRCYATDSTALLLRSQLLPSSVVAYVAALGLLLLLPLDSYSKETYISENALLVNQVRGWPHLLLEWQLQRQPL